MNSQELRIYTLLTHPTAPEQFHISDNGSKLWVILDGGLVCFSGEKLDEMSHLELYRFYQEKRYEYWQDLYNS